MVGILMVLQIILESIEDLYQEYLLKEKMELQNMDTLIMLTW
jgi:hypothetical protein